MTGLSCEGHKDMTRQPSEHVSLACLCPLCAYTQAFGSTSLGLSPFRQGGNPVTRNRTRDHLIAALIYSQMLYQLSYDRLVLPRPQLMLSPTASSMRSSCQLQGGGARCGPVPPCTPLQKHVERFASAKLYFWLSRRHSNLNHVHPPAAV